jgi:hypothetical protein
MKLTSGHLYFINEQDVITGAHSTYYKIGIVRSSDERDSKNRLLEHQTGNPRKLCIVESLEMPAVEAVETNLHYLFARNRVMGEWMSFTESELAQAIKQAKELAAKMPEYIEEFQKAEALKLIKSNGTLLQPTDESQELFALILNFEEVIKVCNEVIEIYEEYLFAAIAKGVDVGGKAAVQSRAGAKRFDEKLFASTYPDLYKKYSSISQSIKGQFRLNRPKDWDVDLSVIDQEQVELIADLKQALENQSQQESLDFNLHAKHLGVIEVLKFAEWEADIATTKLRVLTGQADGITGICSWKRETVEKVNFDKVKVQQDHPDEYNKCVNQGAEVKAFIVEPKNVI